MPNDQIKDEDFLDFDLGDGVEESAPKAVKAEPVEKPETSQNSVQKKAENETKEPDVTEFVEFGTIVSRYAFDRYKAKKDVSGRICVLTNKIVPLKTHYSDENGSFVCFGGKCCEVHGYPRIKYCIPVVVYDTDGSGKPVSQKLKIQVLAVGDEKYKEMIEIAQEFPITEHDLKVTCSDEKFQKMSFIPSPSPCAWKKFSTAKDLVEEWKAKKDRFYECVAKKISPEVFEKRLNEAKPVNLKDQLPEDVVNPDDAFEDVPF